MTDDVDEKANEQWRDLEIRGLRRDVNLLFQHHDRLNTSVAQEYRALSDKIEMNRREHDREHEEQNKVIMKISSTINEIHTETMVRKKIRESRSKHNMWLTGTIIAAIPVVITIMLLLSDWLDAYIHQVMTAGGG